jgi:hypothetical protein
MGNFLLGVVVGVAGTVAAMFHDQVKALVIAVIAKFKGPSKP